MNWRRKDLLGLKDLSKEEINLILDTAVSFKEVLSREVKKVPTLRGWTIASLFFEPSTRTRVSFELAAKRLSADTVTISSSASSVVKGETLEDTAKNLRALATDIIILRHPMAGAPYLLSQRLPDVGIINAGDGMHEHPTQALLDMFSVRERFGRISGLRILIVGDILHSRVARSNIWGLKKMGAEVSVCGPYTLMPKGIEKLVPVYTDLDEAVEGKDVLMFLRIQKERQKDGLFPSLREYHRLYGLTDERLKKIGKKVIIMHPGPVNRGVELSPKAADSKNAIILNQVTNGLAIRMAIIYLISSVLREKRRKKWVEVRE